MSFILDALNKSETERQRQRDPAAVMAPVAAPAKRAPVWPWALGAILLINTAIVLYLAWPDQPAVSDIHSESVPPEPVLSTETVSLPATAVTDGEVRTLSDEADNPGVTASVSRITSPSTGSRSSSRTARVPAPPPATPAGSERSLSELILNGSLPSMDLHIDVHVYHSTPSSRFVVLNSRRYREGDRISEGPMLETITADGAVFVHDGHRFSITTDK